MKAEKMEKSEELSNCHNGLNPTIAFIVVESFLNGDVAHRAGHSVFETQDSTLLYGRARRTILRTSYTVRVWARIVFVRTCAVRKATKLQNSTVPCWYRTGTNRTVRTVPTNTSDTTATVAPKATGTSSYRTYYNLRMGVSRDEALLLLVAEQQLYRSRALLNKVAAHSMSITMIIDTRKGSCLLTFPLISLLIVFLITLWFAKNKIA